MMPPVQPVVPDFLQMHPAEENLAKATEAEAVGRRLAAGSTFCNSTFKSSIVREGSIDVDDGKTEAPMMLQDEATKKKSTEHLILLGDPVGIRDESPSQMAELHDMEDDLNGPPISFEIAQTFSLIESAAYAASSTVSELQEEHNYKQAFKDFQRGRCKYQCFPCNIPFDGSIPFWSHAREIHEIVDPNKLDEEFKNPCTKRVKVPCLICGKKVLHDQGYIKKHLDVHNFMSLEDYFLRHVYHHCNNSSAKDSMITSKAAKVVSQGEKDDQSEESTVNKQEGLNGQNPPAEDSMDTTMSAIVLPEETQMKAEVEGKIVKERASKNVVSAHEVKIQENSDIQDNKHLIFLELPALLVTYNGCIFECSPCQKQFHSKCAILLHFQNEHQMNQAEYIEHFGQFRILENYIMCELCKIEYLQDGLIFQSHLLERHTINLFQYHNLLTSDNSFTQCSLYKCMECDEHVGTNRKSFSNHLKERHKMSTKQHATIHGSQASIKQVCVLCKKVCTTVTAFTKHIQGHNISIREYRFLYWSVLKLPSVKIEAVCESDVDIPAFYNGCVFRCKACTKLLFNSIMQLEQHIASKHNPQTYSQLYESSLVSIKKYACLTCNAEMNHDQRQIEKHLLEVHSMSLKSYFLLHYEQIMLDMENRKKRKIRIFEKPRTGIKRKRSAGNMDSEMNKVSKSSFSNNGALVTPTVGSDVDSIQQPKQTCTLPSSDPGVLSTSNQKLQFKSLKLTLKTKLGSFQYKVPPKHSNDTKNLHGVANKIIDASEAQVVTEALSLDPSTFTNQVSFHTN